MAEILSQHLYLFGVLILDKAFDPVVSSVSVLISFIHPMEGFRMGYYVSGSKMSYKDYLTGKSFVADMTSATQMPEIRPIRWVRKIPMPGAFMICTGMCGNGVRIGMEIILPDRS